MNTLTLLSDAKYFQEGNTRVAETKKMLDSKVDKERLDAMKRLIAMITVGRDASMFFPDVVKNIIVKNMEIKKLVYMFLIHYAEENQELALLSINSFQKDLASENAVVRASAMKAMSDIRIPVVVPLVVLALDIRIPVVVPLVVLALKTAVKDRAPQVCKAAACAIVKVYRVDPEQKEVMVEMIGELLASTHPGVLGAALYAYSAVCPENVEMLHEHFIKIYHLIADFEEWAQIIALSILLRYGRTQFTCPFEDDEVEEQQGPRKAFYSDSEGSDAEEKDEEERKKKKEGKAFYPIAEHHKELLLHCGKLIYSPNAGVILAVAKLFYYLAPQHELAKATRSLVRLLSGRREVAYALLMNIATMVAQRPAAFRPYLEDFYVFATDPVYVRILKLHIITDLVTDTSISKVLQEFTMYTKDPNKDFVASTVQAIGRVAQIIPAEKERCLRLLMRLVQTSRADHVVAQAVVMIRQLLQSGGDPKEHVSVIKSLVKLLDTVKVPMARTALVWIVGEYRDLIPSRAPDCLRKLAISFKEEEEEVKLQILNLAVKLFLANPKQTSLLFKYVMDLSKYDLSYDLRDRARLLRILFFKKKSDGASATAKGTAVKDKLKEVLLAAKPSPTSEAPFRARDRWVLGTMSHLLDRRISGYEPLPPFAETPSDPALRAPLSSTTEGSKSFSLDSDGSDSESQSDSSGSGSDSSGDSSASESESDERQAKDKDKGSKKKGKKAVAGTDSESSSDGESDDDDAASSSGSGSGSSSDDDSDSGSDSSDSESEKRKTKAKEKKTNRNRSPQPKGAKGGMDDLLDLDALKASNALSPERAGPSGADAFDVFGSSFDKSPVKPVVTHGVATPRRGLMGQLLNSIKGGGLQVNFAIDRKPSLFSAKMNAISLTLLNKSSTKISKIHIIPTDSKSGELMPFDQVECLNPGQQISVTMHVDFQGKPGAFKFALEANGERYQVQLTPGAGEVCRPSAKSKALDAATFDRLKASLSGMNESTATVEVSGLPADAAAAGTVLATKLVKRLNVYHIPPASPVTTQRFAAAMIQDGGDCFITLTQYDDKVTIYDQLF
eukprot:g68684.t1